VIHKQESNRNRWWGCLVKLDMLRESCSPNGGIKWYSLVVVQLRVTRRIVALDCYHCSNAGPSLITVHWELMRLSG